MSGHMWKIRQNAALQSRKPDLICGTLGNSVSGDLHTVAEVLGLDRILLTKAVVQDFRVVRDHLQLM